MTLLNFKRVILPVDGSDNALRAVDHGGALAAAAGLEVHLLHVMPPSPLEVMQVMGYPAAARDEARASAAAFEQARQSTAAAVLEKARTRLPSDIRVVEIARPGDPAEVILNYTKLVPDAVIVVGHRGLSAIRELVMGSVSQKIIHHAACPVTIVP
ncbi:MAG: universal stress protein [Chromatiales bacterium]|nr:universal stress protein [Chromatiales bacterium]